MSTAAKERKVSQSASSKIDSIVRQLFLPMVGMHTPALTSFQPEDGDEALVRQVATERPGVMVSEAEFIEYMVQLYRRFQGGQEAVSVSSVNASVSSVDAAVN